MKKYRLIDDSGSLIVINDKLEKTGNVVSEKEYYLIADNLDLPAEDCGGLLPGRRNNIILKDTSSGEIIFSQYKYLQEIAKTPFTWQGVVKWTKKYPSGNIVPQRIHSKYNEFQELEGKITRIQIEEIID